MLLYGAETVAKFAKAHVLIVGLGGVGGASAEFLGRAGIGKFTVADGDKIEPSNRNRQLPALSSTEGKLKTAVLAERLRDINPDVEIIEIPEFIRDKKTDEILEVKYDFAIDAIDTLSPKINLIAKLIGRGIPLVSSMGSGGKSDISQVKVSDIEDSFNCPLARMVRKRLHRMGIRGGFRVVFSPESCPENAIENCPEKNRSIVGTVSYMPAVFGAYCAAEVIQSIRRETGKKHPMGEF